MDELTAERLRDALDYNPETGEFRWKSPRKKVVVGSIAGCVSSDGYRRIRIDGDRYRAHRLAWLYVNGRWPAFDIDHINGLRADNRIENLREARRGENNQNKRSPQTNNKSGFLGVTRRKDTGRWRAAIMISRKHISIGDFETPEEAYAAYLKAKAEFHPFQTIAEAA